MAARSGSIVPSTPLNDGTIQTPVGNRSRPGTGIAINVISAGISQTPVGNRGRTSKIIYTTTSVMYKNVGWYAATSTWETWISNDAPSTTPPSGHTLTSIQHYLLK